MPIQVQSLVIAAVARSTKNREGAIVDVGGEMLALCTRSLRGFFAVAGKVNPDFFGTTATVAYSGPVTGWPQPSDLVTMTRIEMADGTEVDVFDKGSRGMAIEGEPAVYRLGQVYKLAGGSSGPTTSDSLKFWYARTCEIPSAITDEIDAEWPEDHNDLLVVDIALYLAKKDGRGDDVATLRPEWEWLFTQWVDRLRTSDAVTGRFTDFDRAIPNTVLTAMTLGGGNG